jgi:hypothetical protein
MGAVAILHLQLAFAGIMAGHERSASLIMSRPVFATVLGLCLLLTTNCCTTIGWGVGWYADHSTPDYRFTSSSAVQNLNSGDRVRLRLNNGTEIDGSYVRMQPASRDRGAAVEFQAGHSNSELIDVGRVAAVGLPSYPRVGRKVGIIVGLVFDLILLAAAATTWGPIHIGVGGPSSGML